MTIPLQFASLYDCQEVLCGPIACWILAWTSSVVTQSLYVMCSILRQHLISKACILVWSSAGKVCAVKTSAECTNKNKDTSYKRKGCQLTAAHEHWMSGGLLSVFGLGTKSVAFAFNSESERHNRASESVNTKCTVILMDTSPQYTKSGLNRYRSVSVCKDLNPTRAL